MLRLYRDSTHPLADASLKEFPREVIWIDLVSPTDDEKNLVEKRTGVNIPSVEALSEIESSSRFAVDRDIVTLSTPVVAQGDGPDAFLSPVGFILTKRFIVSIRFADLTAFTSVADLIRGDEHLRTSSGVFIALLEAFVGRGADVLERLGADLDKVSRSVFRGDVSQRRHTVRSNRSLRRVLSIVGATGDRLSLARDALLGFGRIAQFVATLEQDWFEPEFKARLAEKMTRQFSLDPLQRRWRAATQAVSFSRAGKSNAGPA